MTETPEDDTDQDDELGFPRPDHEAVKDERQNIEYALAGADRAVLSVDGGPDVELDLSEHHYSDTAVWGIEEPSGHWYNRLRIINAPVRIIGHSDDGVEGAHLTATIDVDAEGAEEYLDELEERIEQVEDGFLKLQRMIAGVNQSVGTVTTQNVWSSTTGDDGVDFSGGEDDD